MTPSLRRRSGLGFRPATMMVIGVVAAFGALAGPATAAEPVQQAGAGDDGERLAERFAPIIMLKRQDEACSTDGEQFRPSSVEIVLGNPEVALRQVGDGNPVVMWGPAASDLHGLGEGFFLDFPGGSLSPECIYERDFEKYTGDRPAAVYAHIVQPLDAPGVLFLQYWFYWYYNDWNNTHESDWEGITLKFEASSIGEALAGEPVAVGYAQHEGGERADWDASKLERVGDHPVVYASAGSHASYFGSAVYLGRSASEGFGCDDTSGPSEAVEPEVVLLPDAVTDPADPLAWVAFSGRWGERHAGPFNGPTGPAVKERWLDPVPAFDDLRPSSVVVPAGDSLGAAVIGAFCGVVEAGSNTLISLSVSPLQLLVTGLILVLLLRFLIGRTDWSDVAPTPIRRRRRAGQIIRAAARLYRDAPRPFVVFGLVYLPAAVLTGAVARTVELIPLVGSVLSLTHGSGGTSLVMTLIVGSATNFFAFVVVNALVADYLHHDANGTDAMRTSARRVWERRSDIAGGAVRAFVIVAVLFATVVGIPWGIRQFVRYQFVAQAVMLDDCTGRKALGRSSQLVTGRWLHTAIVVTVLNGLVLVTALVAGLLLLLVTAGLPLWLFSALASIAYVLVVPLAAIALTLLYGDAAVDEQHVSPPAPTAVG